MPQADQFSYQGLFAKTAPKEPPRAATAERAKYDFAVAYPDPESLPLDDLAESLKMALDEEGKDLAVYPHQMGYPPLRQHAIRCAPTPGNALLLHLNFSCELAPGSHLAPCAVLRKRKGWLTLGAATANHSGGTASRRRSDGSRRRACGRRQARSAPHRSGPPSGPSGRAGFRQRRDGTP